MHRFTLVLAAASTLFLATFAHAESKDGKRGNFVVRDQLTQNECSACHMAFPPGLLPKESWNAIMGNLANHFGEDASLDAQSAKAIRTYLADNAMQMGAVSASNPPLRITEMYWFTHEHGKKRIQRALQDPRVGTLSNCVACHRGAASGTFDDD